VLTLLPALSIPPTAAAFPDVPDTASCANAVQQLTQRGIIKGYQDGTFGPGDPLLRSQAAATIIRAAGWSGETPSRDFTDQGTTDAELWRAVRILADRGVARGFPDGTFQPLAGLTRQQAISFVARMMVTLGVWEAQAATTLFGDVADAHSADVATYYRYAGAIPQVAPADGATPMGADRSADRCWYAETLWGAAWHLGPSLDTPTPLYWGAYINGSPWDLSALDQFEARARKPVSVVHWGQPWWHDGGYQPFQAEIFDRVRGRGAIPLIDWASWDHCCGTEQPAFALAAVARGDHDTYIRQWAAAARDWGHPFFLRFDWEMNGSWQFPWSVQRNGNQPGDYVAAWRHVHDLFAQVGATNVTWVWCPNVVSPQTVPLDQLYPGDGYVDWVAMDGYNFGTVRNDTWRSFAEIFGETYAALRQLAPGKPVMIAETASSEHGGDKAAWIRDALGAQLPTQFPAIKAVVWFNWDDNDPGLTWPIESSAAATSAFGDVIDGSGVYMPNRFGTLDVNPIPPPGP
jgi:hypothetical protein